MINERLKILLDELHMSQRQFANRISLDPGYLSRIIQGKVNPPARILLLIENIFHVNKRWLETGEGNIFTSQALTAEKKEIYKLIEELDDEQVNAVSAFIKYLREKEHIS